MKPARRDERTGRFVKGHGGGPGRKPGRAWSAWASAFEWLTETKLHAWLDRLNEQALDGDQTACRILLDRFLPARIGVAHISQMGQAPSAVLPLDWRPAEPECVVPDDMWADGPPTAPPGPMAQDVQAEVIRVEGRP